VSELVLRHIRREQLLKAGDRVGVAVSGGIDSVALLQLLLELRGELGIVLSVVHFNHKLRGPESDDDQRFVAELAGQHGLEFLSDGGDVARHAAKEALSLETAARELRYRFFHQLLRESVQDDPHGLQSDSSPEFKAPAEARIPVTLDKIVTGHTLDDQAETVLMRIIRGTGLSGLGGIHPRLRVEDEDGETCGEIIRPLLITPRRQLKQYLEDIGQAWREDSTNADHGFTRNRVRGLLIPVLEREFNPAVAENLAELSEIARGEEEYWDNEVAGWMGTAVHWSEPEWARARAENRSLVQIGGLPTDPPSGAQSVLELSRLAQADAVLQERIDEAPWLVANASVSRPWFLSEPIAVQRRVAKAIGEHAGIPLEFRHIDEIVRFAAEEGHSGGEVSLPYGWRLLRYPEELLFVTPDLRQAKAVHDYEYELSLPGRIVLSEAGVVLEAWRVPAHRAAEYNPDQLLDADSLPGQLRVRNWRPGDRFWPAHTKSPKKIKELLQERHVAQPHRRLWPVVLSGDEILWVRGFAPHAKFRVRAGHDAVLISEASET
jgi:tRNA(Ile)-lysidine synthase